MVVTLSVVSILRAVPGALLRAHGTCSDRYGVIGCRATCILSQSGFYTLGWTMRRWGGRSGGVG